MRRADRLFRLIQLLRGGRVVTAAELGRELEISVRTVYRDVRDLIVSGVPIEGEAGVGYCLPREFDLPPLMFDEEEIRALVLGARMVQAWGDRALARRARSVLSKVEAALPPGRRRQLEDVELFVPLRLPEAIRGNIETFRRGVSEVRKVRLGYVDIHGRETERVVRPLCLWFWGSVWTATAWCELRGGFRNFRPDRMREAELLEVYQEEPERDLAAFLRNAPEGRILDRLRESSAADSTLSAAASYRSRGRSNGPPPSGRSIERPSPDIHTPRRETMSLSASMLPEFDIEMASTRKVLEALPEADLDWKPHDRSMPLARLGSHLAEIPDWCVNALTEPSIDLAPVGKPPYEPLILKTRKEILALFDKNAAAARAALEATPDKAFGEMWSLEKGGVALMTMPRAAVLRSFCLNHMIHHRGQLTVFLRLKEIPVPATYGPSADEGVF